MAKKGNGNDGVNKSAAIRDYYKQSPDAKVKEVIAALAAKGITVGSNLVYLVKGKMRGETQHRRKANRAAVKVATSSGNTDAVKTILKVKALANEVGGLNTLKSLVDALCD
jgi:hypothetical protein